MSNRFDSEMAMARALRDGGRSPAEVAVAMSSVDGGGRRKAAVFAALASEEGLGLGAEGAVRELQGLWAPGEIAQAMAYGLEVGADRVALALYKGLDLQLQRPACSVDPALYVVAKALGRAPGLLLPAADVAAALHSKAGLNLGAREVAAVLYREEGLGLSAPDVARALGGKAHHLAWPGIGLSPACVAHALSSRRFGLELSTAQVANALFSARGLNLRMGEVAKALHDANEGPGMDLPAVARALHAREGCDLPITSVVRALHDKDGLGLDPPAIAKALISPRGLGLSADKIAAALCDRFDGLGLEVEAVAVALHSPDGAGLQLGEVFDGLRGCVSDAGAVRALRDGLGLGAKDIAYILLDGRMEMPDFARPLYEGLDLSLRELARLLHGDGDDGETVAQCLYERDAMGLDADLVARVMHKALGLDADAIIVAINRGCGLPSDRLAAAINEGLDLDIDAEHVLRVVEEANSAHEYWSQTTPLP